LGAGRAGRARPLRWHATLLAAALAVYAAWIASLLLLMGAGHIMANVRLLRSASGGALIVLSPARMAAGFKLLLGPSSLLLVAPASLLALLPLRRATGDRRLALTAIWVFEALWLGWFATASIAWPRYAFPGIALSTIFIGWLIPAAVDEARRRAGHVASAGAGRAVALAGVAAIALALGVGLWVELSPLARGDQRDPQRFAARLDATVPRGAVVDAWEPELGFLSNAALQYPPPGSLDKVVRDQWLGQTKPHDFSAGLTGQYLVVGPFARWVGAYDAALQSSHYALDTEVGGYALYQRVP
jgi:hypothetical protein